MNIFLARVPNMAPNTALMGYSTNCGNAECKWDSGGGLGDDP